MLFLLGWKWLVDMLKVKSMGKFHFILYKIYMGCVCHCEAWPAWWCSVSVVSTKVLIYSLLFKLKVFSVCCIYFNDTECLREVSVAPQFASGCLITANNKIYLVMVKQRNGNSWEGQVPIHLLGWTSRK